MTVAADECALADAMATALIVLGTGTRVRLRHGTAPRGAFRRAPETAGFVDRVTPDFAALGGQALEAA